MYALEWLKNHSCIEEYIKNKFEHPLSTGEVNFLFVSGSFLSGKIRLISEYNLSMAES